MYHIAVKCYHFVLAMTNTLVVVQPNSPTLILVGVAENEDAIMYNCD